MNKAVVTEEHRMLSKDKQCGRRHFVSLRVLPWLKVEPLYEPLRDDPPFSELLRKVGFPQ